jgi:hypothetical protein
MPSCVSVTCSDVKRLIPSSPRGPRLSSKMLSGGQLQELSTSPLLCAITSNLRTFEKTQGTVLHFYSYCTNDSLQCTKASNRRSISPLALCILCQRWSSPRDGCTALSRIFPAFLYFNLVDGQPLIPIALSPFIGPIIPPQYCSNPGQSGG